MTSQEKKIINSYNNKLDHVYDTMAARCSKPYECLKNNWS